MQFRIVSTTPAGVYASSQGIISQEAVSLFLSLVRDCFPEQLDNPVMSEVSLRKFVEQENLPAVGIYAGQENGWKIVLAPIMNDIPLPSEN